MRAHFLACLLTAGCAAPSALRPESALSRVVVYRSGVAYFERSATLDDDHLRLAVPTAQVNDFLKSLTVVDEATGAPAPVSYQRAAEGAGTVELTVPLSGPRPHRLKLSYITESPSWKPTYRAVLGSAGKVSLEGWAIVDNDSGEDWSQVALGVGSSSALSFRYDLQSRRSVEREQLGAGEHFAFAPPTGEAPYGSEPAEGQAVLGELADEPAPGPAPSSTPAAARESADVSLVRIETAQGMIDKQVAAARVQRDAVKVLCLTDKATQLEHLVRMARERRKAAEGADDTAIADADRSVIRVLRQRGDQLAAEANQCLGQEASFAGGSSVTMTVDPSLPPDEGESLARLAQRQREAAAARQAPPPVPSPRPAERAPAPPPRSGLGDLRRIVEALRARPGPVVIEGYARPSEADPRGAALGRAGRARDALIAQGIEAGRVSAVYRGRAEGGALLRFVRGPADHLAEATRTARALAEPIGASHFESPVRLTLARGGSAMISIVKADTQGEVVYLYDAESARGNASFPFRAVRLVNPTDSTLESGPVTVFGEGRFVGEGMCEPIPARSAGFVPFALDRQVVADARTDQTDGPPRLTSADGETLTTEVDRRRRTRITLYNRQAAPAVVYVRHTVPAGYELSRAPAERERAGGAYLFKATVPAAGRADVEIEEATVLTTTRDVWSPEGLDAVRVWVAAAAASPSRDTLVAVVKLAEEASSLQQKLSSAQASLAEERRHADRLRGQIASLRGAGTSPALLAPLDQRLGHLDQQISRATLDAFGLDERLAVIRVKVADAAHDLHLQPAGGGGPGVARGR